MTRPEMIAIAAATALGYALIAIPTLMIILR